MEKQLIAGTVWLHTKGSQVTRATPPPAAGGQSIRRIQDQCSEWTAPDPALL